MKTLDKKLHNIKSSNNKPSDFIIADAKDADMAGGIRGPGYVRKKDGALTDIPDNFSSYVDKMENMTKSKLVDVMLMSMSSAEILVKKKLFKNSPVTPAIRLNDTTCTWGMIRNGDYDTHESRPFSTAQLRHAIELVDLGLYSITFNKNTDRDVLMLNKYREFRKNAEEIGMRHFLEVFNSATLDLSIIEMGQYVNDCILKTLAGQISKEKPIFLKIPYNGPSAMEELSSYDPQSLTVGILGGSKGTTRDCFELIKKAYKYGARVALFGRKINLSEDQITIVEIMRTIIENNLESLEGVKLYHDRLTKLGIKSDRNLQDDSEITEEVLKL
ncbi:hypothetical protein OA492_00365 [Pelagibacteraceae bacterium]|nr:hypothetical protein [Pelagibacteraceae bacterium]